MRRVPFKGIMALAALSLVLGFAAVIAFARNEADRRAAQATRRVDIAQSVLFNCQAIEGVKTELRGTLVDSLQQLPKAAYYQTHPTELLTAVRNTKASIERFSAFDCYTLPNVRDAGLKP